MTTTVSRYITDQVKSYADGCQEEEQYEETVDFHAMLHFTTKSLILSELSELTIRGSSEFRFSDESVTVMVGGILKSKLSLASLVLTHHRIKDIGMIQICRLILPTDADVNGLQELDLEGNDIGAIGCAAIQECLESAECNLASLNLSCNALSAKGGILIADALSVNRTLVNLVLANCDLDLTTEIAVATNIQNNNTISTLVLDRPILSSKEDELSDHFSRVLGQHRSLHSLSLRYCRVNDHGVFLFSQELITNNMLRCLNLECNCIGIKGAEALASYLIQKNQLQSLMLTSNRVCDDGAIALASALRTNRSLEELTLRHNEIGVEGLVALGNALRKNDALLFLSLWGNGFEDVSSQLFHDLFETRFPYLDIKLDIRTYEVDGVHYVAESSF